MRIHHLFARMTWVAGGVACLAVPIRAHAQAAGSGEDSVYPTDAYGNVQPVEQRWRPLGAFSNPIERDALLGYQTMTRRTGQRSGLEPFALPGDVWSVSRLVASGTESSPSVKQRLSPGRRSAFQRYGGFGRRRPSYESEDGSEMLTRRQGLIAANALNAPVYRALTRSNTLVDLQSTVVRTPFLTSDVSPSDQPQPSLDERLDVADRFGYQRVRDEAWALLRDGQYRGAIRAFETAITLEPSDHESRIGEIFAYLAVGARRTSLALLTELVRRDENPFAPAFGMRERLPGAADANTLQIQGRLAAEDQNQNAEVNALYILVLWYLGVQDDALRAAESLARREPGKPYALWPEKMRAARSPSAAPTP